MQCSYYLRDIIPFGGPNTSGIFFEKYPLSGLSVVLRLLNRNGEVLTLTIPEMLPILSKIGKKKHESEPHTYGFSISYILL